MLGTSLSREVFKAVYHRLFLCRVFATLPRKR
ncbi:hypothetical protein VPHK250G1_0059 [Vibrio phage K250 g1]